MKMLVMIFEMSFDVVLMNKFFDEDRRRYVIRSNEKNVIERIILFLDYW